MWVKTCSFSTVRYFYNCIVKCDCECASRHWHTLLCRFSLAGCTAGSFLWTSVQVRLYFFSVINCPIRKGELPEIKLVIGTGMQALTLSFICSLPKCSIKKRFWSMYWAVGDKCILINYCYYCCNKCTFYRFPNMVVANLTRDSVRAALARGITAEQVWTYSNSYNYIWCCFCPKNIFKWTALYTSLFQYIQLKFCS